MNTRSSTLARRLALILMAGVLAACTGMGKAPKTVLVAGATGQTGVLIVRQLQQQGYHVRALVRDPEKARGQLGPDVDYVQGDVKDAATVNAAAAGVQAVVSSLGARGKDGPDRPEMIDYHGVRNLVDAARAARVRQFVLISSRGVTDKNHVLNRMFGNVLVWKLEGENYLRASGLAYTIVRPGGLLNEPGGKGEIVLEQGDKPVGGRGLFIPREDVATLCVEALEHPEAKFRTFEVHRVDGPPVSDWKARFAALKPDPRP